MKRIISLLMALTLLCGGCLAESDGITLETLDGGSLEDVRLNQPIALNADSVLRARSFEAMDRMGYYQAGQTEVGGPEDYYNSGSDADYLVLRVDIQNNGDEETDYLAGAEVRVTGAKKYAGWAFQLNDFNATATGDAYGADSGVQNTRWVINGADNFPIRPGGTGRYVFGCTVPTAELGTPDALTMEVRMSAGSFAYQVRPAESAADLPVQAVEEAEGTAVPEATPAPKRMARRVIRRIRQSAAPSEAPTPGIVFDFLSDDEGEEAAPSATPLLPDLTCDGPDVLPGGTTSDTEPEDGEGNQTGVESISAYAGALQVETSSYRVNNDRSIPVDGYCAIDGDLSTAWNTANRSAGEWIRLSVDDGRQYEIAGFRVANGYWKNGSVYRNNSRVRSLDVYCDERYIENYELADVISCQTFWLPEPVACASITLVIRDVYSGARYRDCALTEVELIGSGGNLLSRDALGDWGGAVRLLQTEVADNGVSFGVGAKGLPVAGLQLLLREGFEVLDGSIDGDFGPGTRQAVMTLADYMTQTLSDMAQPMTPGVVDAAYWENMLAYMDTFTP